MNRPLPPHGTAARYGRGCHCTDCRADHAAQQRHRTRMRAYGRPSHVDATPAREHVNLLLRYHTMHEIARIAGVDPLIILRLLTGTDGRPPSRKLRAENAAKILAAPIGLDHLEPGALVRVHGTRRRLQALATLGWPTKVIAVVAGVGDDTLRLARDKQRYVRADTARRVRAAYDELWDRDPRKEVTGTARKAVTFARAFAASHGWVGPLAWDDDTIDDPEAQPNLGEETSADLREVRLENYDWLIRGGISSEQAAKQVGVELETIAEYRRRIAKAAAKKKTQAARDKIGAAA